MERRRSVAAVLAALSIALAACTGPGGSSSPAPSRGSPGKPRVRLGVVAFTEQAILGQIYGQALARAGYAVTYQRLASRELADPALFAGYLDLLIEYAGSDLTYLKGTPTADDRQILTDLRARLRPRDVSVLEQAPASDQQAITMTRATADRHGTRTLSDLAAVAGQLVFGAPPECFQNRRTCYKGMQETYGIDFKAIRPIPNASTRYQALLGDQIQANLSFSTDGIIARQGLVVVQDDKRLFPPDHVVPIARNDFLGRAGGELRSTVRKISAAITTDDLTALNAKVDLDQEDPGRVAAAWLREKNLLA
jgi:osmoprotectant transport system substrate-binding protein